MAPFMWDELEKILNQLLQMVFQRDTLDKADTPLQKLNRNWLQNGNLHLEDGLVDLGAATKDLVENDQISAEKKEI